MKYALAVSVFAAVCVAPPAPAATLRGSAAEAGGATPSALSARLTAAADELFIAEQRAAAAWRNAAPDDAIDAVLYDDVLSLLDAAIGADENNLHAHALSAQILLLKAYDGEGYDVCTLLDSRDDAEYVVARAPSASEADLATARTILRQIRRIPPSAIPDPQSNCGEDDDDATGKTSEAR